MHPLPIIRVPIRKTDHKPFTGTLPAFATNFTTVDFKRQDFAHDGQYLSVYECMEGKCRGCGCPSFTASLSAIPWTVIEHLKRHATLCEGLVRSKVPQ